MALIVGNKRVQSITPLYDGTGQLTGIIVSVNRSIMDDTTIPPTIKYGLPTSQGVDILPQLSPPQRAAATAFLSRVAALASAPGNFEE